MNRLDKIVSEDHCYPADLRHFIQIFRQFLQQPSGTHESCWDKRDSKLPNSIIQGVENGLAWDQCRHHWSRFESDENNAAIDSFIVKDMQAYNCTKKAKNHEIQGSWEFVRLRHQRVWIRQENTCCTRYWFHCSNRMEEDHCIYSRQHNGLSNGGCSPRSWMHPHGCRLWFSRHLWLHHGQYT